MAKGKSRHWFEGAGDAQIPSFLGEGGEAHTTGQAQGGRVAADGQGLPQADQAPAGTIEKLALPAQGTAGDGIASPGSLFNRHGVGNQLEGAARLSLGHGGPVELALVVIPAPGNRQDAAVAAVEHHHSPFADAQPGAGQKLLPQQALHQVL